MKHEFKVKQYKDATVYTLESATSGGTSAGVVGTGPAKRMGPVISRGGLVTSEEKKDAPKPRNFVAKNAKMGGAGQHKDKKKAAKQGDVKHKKPFAEDHEVSMASNELKSIHANAQKLLGLVQQYGENGDLEAWQQSKITKAADYLNSVLQSIGGEQDALDEMNIGDYRKKAGMQKAQAGMSAMFARDPAEREKNLAIFNKRERGLNRLKARDEKERKAQQEKQTADLVARLPELKAEYEQMKARYKSLGGSDWQYADREQNLTSAEREARSMEGEMSNLWRQIQAAEKAQGMAEDPYMEQLASKVAEKLDPNAPTDVWVKDFQKANPNKYHQFKNKTPAKKAQMAVAAHYAANEPSKK